MITNSIKLVVILLLSLSLAACMSSAPAPLDHYYRLTSDSANEQAGYRLPYSVIGIPPAMVSGLYRERPILFVESDAPLELQQYHYHHWHDVPANLVQEHFIAMLQRMVPQTRFVHLDRGDQHETIIQIRILRFERELKTRDTSVLVRLELKLQKDHQVLHKKTYQQSISVSGNSMHDTVEAFDTALNHIYDAFLQDISR